MHRKAQVRIDRVGGNAEFFANLTMRQTLESAQSEDFPATRRQHGDGFVQYFDFLGMGDGFGRIGPLFYHEQGVHIPYTVDGHNLVAPDNVESRIACGHEEVGSYLRDFARRVCAEQSRERFLYEIVHVAQSGKASAEIRPQCRLVWLHLFRKPAGIIVRAGKLTKGCRRRAQWRA